MRKMIITLAATLALSGAMAAENWDGSSWVYTPETHQTISPSVSESPTSTVSSAYWSMAWNVLRVVFRPGMFMIVR